MVIIMREKFLRMLDLLCNELYTMGNLVEMAIDNSINGLKTADKDLINTVFEIEENVNHKEKDIERLCLRLILQQQPVAKDLKLISSALKMIRDMERISDNAKDIANISLKLLDSPVLKELEIIHKMSDITIKMVHLSIDAFVNKGLEIINQVIELDDEVDNLFLDVKNELSILISRNPQDSTAVIELLLLAKYLEKISDHAVNIANSVNEGIR
jgi:phosphate transport system protein